MLKRVCEFFEKNVAKKIGKDTKWSHAHIGIDVCICMTIEQLLSKINVTAYKNFMVTVRKLKLSTYFR